MEGISTSTDSEQKPDSEDNAMGERPILEDVILHEIAGKNAAIHAYDGIIWKIRSGYVALVFGGWAILLKSLAEGSIGQDHIFIVVISMFLVNLGMSFGGCFIDCNYVRRKFRVILALNNLVKSVKDNREDLDLVSHELLRVAGDDAKMSYKCDGYREAALAGKLVYFITALFLAGCVLIIVSFWN
jgi:hypothetical protein